MCLFASIALRPKRFCNLIDSGMRKLELGTPGILRCILSASLTEMDAGLMYSDLCNQRASRRAAVANTAKRRNPTIPETSSTSLLQVSRKTHSENPLQNVVA
jgi:hypothetical protein